MNIKMIEGFTPIVEINNKALQKMREYTSQSIDEIGWLGTARKIEDKHYIIDDVFLFKQEVHSTTTEITTEGLMEFCQELMLTENGMDIWNNMKVWGHSHVNMSTSPSGQDNDQIKIFSDNAQDFFIRIITNKREELRLDLYDYETGVAYEEMNFIVNYGEDEEQIRNIQALIQQYKNILDDLLETPKELSDEISNEIKEKVSKKTYVSNNVKTYNGYTYGSGNGYWDYWNNKTPKDFKKKETNVTSTEKDISLAEFIFDELNREEIFQIKAHVDYGGNIEDCIEEKLSIGDVIELEELIDEYCDINYNEYVSYLVGEEY